MLLYPRWRGVPLVARGELLPKRLQHLVELVVGQFARDTIDQNSLGIIPA
jgi:hypothetical protein